MENAADLARSTIHDMMRGSVPAARRPRTVVLVLTEGFSLIEMGCLVEVFDVANRKENTDLDGNCYRLLLVSQKGGAVRSSLGVLVWTDAVESRHVDDVHAVFVVGGPCKAYKYDERILAWLRRVYGHAEIVQSVGSGQFALESAGLTHKSAQGSSEEVSSDDTLDSVLALVNRFRCYRD
ncbi:DJ-1/PfpI family protein [Paraburkholderia rhynchosiae]|nr:DJ-1/PfpI family protein [Paraburkholderia rhynchosiae]CAB3696291.1 hypothetical protein LMG27174_03438 [Paraburkholderia rhynchosiae]